MTWTPDNGCRGKQGFLSKASAKAMCASLNAKNARFRQPLAHIYKCPGCFHYHIGRPIGLNGGSPE